MEGELRSRLCGVADALAMNGLPPFPLQVWVVWRDGAVVAVASSERQAHSLMIDLGADSAGLVEVNKAFPTAQAKAS